MACEHINLIRGESPMGGLIKPVGGVYTYECESCRLILYPSFGEAPPITVRYGTPPDLPATKESS